jgi:hypothetical protein
MWDSQMRLIKHKAVLYRDMDTKTRVLNNIIIINRRSLRGERQNCSTWTVHEFYQRVGIDWNTAEGWLRSESNNLAVLLASLKDTLIVCVKKVIAFKSKRLSINDTSDCWHIDSSSTACDHNWDTFLRNSFPE